MSTALPICSDAAEPNPSGAQEAGLFASAEEALDPEVLVDADADPDEPEPEADRGALVAALDDDALAALIARIMNQDERALATLYQQLSSQVYALVLRVTRQVGVAEEVLEDVFWQVWRQAPRFTSQRGSVRAWVLTIARSRAIDAARSRGRDLKIWDQRDLSEMDDSLPSDAAGPPDLLAAAQAGSQLHQALLGLDPLRRQLVSLSFFHGMTHQEIAEHAGLPLGTVKSHLRRSLIALGEALGGSAQPGLA